MDTVQPNPLSESLGALHGTIPEELHDGRVVPDQRLGVVGLPVEDVFRADAKNLAHLFLHQPEHPATSAEVIAKGFAVGQFLVTI